MSKSLNLYGGVFGGVALLLGAAYGLSMRDFRAAEAEVALERARIAEARLTAAEAQIASVVASVAAADAEKAALEQRLAKAQAAAAALQEASAGATATQPGAILVDASVSAAPAVSGKLGLGRAALPEEVAAWDKDVSPNGEGLPVGSGSVADGEEIFSANCAVCHGEFAEGVDNWPKLAGGAGTLDHDDPLKTVGSYWPHLSTTWDYVHRSMPYGAAQTLSADDTYAIVAYILYSNDLVDDDFVLTNENFLSVELPNADGFILDDRETAEKHFWKAEPCMTNCKDTVEITMRATVLDVTPNDPNDTAPVAAPAMAAEPEKKAEAPAAAPVAAAPVVVAAVAETPAAVPAAAGDADLIAKGEKVFKQCSACHQVGEGAKNRVGPVLNGIIGQQVASVEGFKYSKGFVALGEEGKVWDAALLSELLTKPKDFVKGTKMSFAGLKKQEDIDAVTAYLASQTK